MGRLVAAAVEGTQGIESEQRTRWLWLRATATAAVTLFAALALALAAESARAETFCAPAPCGEGTQQATIGDAVDAADAQAGPDTVVIGPGTHLTPPEGCGVFVGRVDTTVRGSGVKRTVLTSPDLPPDAGFSRQVICGNMQLSDLTLRLPSAVTPGQNSSVEGFDLYSGSIDNVRVDDKGAEFGAGTNDGQGSAGLIRGGSLSEVVARLDRDQDTTGIRSSGLPRLSDLDVRAKSSALDVRVDQGLGDPPMRVENVKLKAALPLAVSNETGVNSEMQLSNAVLDASKAGDTAKVVGATVVNGLPPEAVGLTMDGVTIVGNGAKGSVAIALYGQGRPLPTTLDARHVIATGFRKTLEFGFFGGDVGVAVSHSLIDLRDRKVITDGSDGAASTDSGPKVRRGNPRFVGGSDYRLKRRSPAVDIGGADLFPRPATDVFGAPRPTDGDWDGRSRADAGAYEFQNNRFRVRRIKRDTEAGTARVVIKVPGAGKLVAKGKEVKKAKVRPVTAGKARVAIEPKGKARRKLRRKGSVGVATKLAYTPEFGTRATKRRTVKLIRTG